MGYVHAGGKIGVLVNLAVEGGVDATEVGKDVAMQIAALNPRFWDKTQVTEDVLAEEKKIALALMDSDPKMASKPAQVKEKIVMGKMNKFYEENCLLQHGRSSAATSSRAPSRSISPTRPRSWAAPSSSSTLSASRRARASRRSRRTSPPRSPRR